MHFTSLILTANPFFEAYGQSDLLGKMIFIALYLLSICSWVVLLHKLWIMQQQRRLSLRFQEVFRMQRANPLSLECDQDKIKQQTNPFLNLYYVLKKQASELLTKSKQVTPSLSVVDMDFLSSHLSIQYAHQVRELDKNLYILATTMSLAPFLGLLGTVWGILTTFSELQSQAPTGTHQVVLGGLSMALATTVLGLIVAIPALIGYNYLKNASRDFAGEMEGFSSEILAAVELQYSRA